MKQPISKWIPDGYKSRFEALMDIVRFGPGLLGEAEFKAVLFHAERTAGWGKPSDSSSYDQMVNGIERRNGGGHVRAGCGLSKGAAAKANFHLEKKGLLKRETRKHADGGYSATEYSINWPEIRAYFQAKLATTVVSQEDTPLSSKKTSPLVFQKDIQSRTDHHQQSRSLQGSEVLQPVRREQAIESKPASPSEVPTVPEIKSTAKPSGNGEADSVLQGLRDAPKPSTDHEARERTSKLMAIGKEQDVENALRKVGKQLQERDGLWIDYWEKAKQTGAPRAVAGGHYVQLAKNLATEIKVSILELRTQRTALRVPEESQRCTKCGGGGFLSKTEYCDCLMGLDLAKVERRKQAKEASTALPFLPPGSEPPKGYSMAGAAA
jgi:hypothetical protein